MVMESPYVVMTISTAAMATAVAMVAEVDSSMIRCAFGSLANLLRLGFKFQRSPYRIALIFLHWLVRPV